MTEQARQAVYEAINRERRHQDHKWGTIASKDGSQSLPGWLLILEDHVAKAKAAWNAANPVEARREIVQVGATSVACLEQHGSVGRKA